MLKFIKSFFGKKSQSKYAHPLDAVTTPNVEAPYKVEAPTVDAIVAAPEPAKCGCGRSPTGLCVGLHKLTAEEWASHSDNPAKPAVPAKKAAAKKAPAKPAPAKKTPAAIKAAPKSSTRKTKKPAP
jgi:hypothetical protein